MIAYEVLLTTEPSFSNPSFKICFVCLFVLFYGRSILLYSPGWSAMHYIARIKPRAIFPLSLPCTGIIGMSHYAEYNSSVSGSFFHLHMLITQLSTQDSGSLRARTGS